MPSNALHCTGRLRGEQRAALHCHEQRNGRGAFLLSETVKKQSDLLSAIRTMIDRKKDLDGREQLVVGITERRYCLIETASISTHRVSRERTPQDEQAQLPGLDRRSVGELLRAQVVAGEQQRFAREYALEYQDWFKLVLQQRALALASHAKLGFAYIGDAPDKHKAGVSQGRFQVQAAIPLVMCERSRWRNQE